MEVEITLALGLEKYTSQNKHSLRLEVPPSSNIGDVVAILALPSTEPWLITLNGRQAFLETELSPEDSIKIFPMLAGG